MQVPEEVSQKIREILGRSPAKTSADAPDKTGADKRGNLKESKPVRVILSRFGSGDDEGWRTQHEDGTFAATHPVNVDSNSSGYWLRGHKLQEAGQYVNPSKQWGWLAPAKYLGEHSDKFGRLMKYSLWNERWGECPATDWCVRLKGGELVLFLDGTAVGPHPTNGWRGYTIRLDESCGWKKTP